MNTIHDQPDVVVEMTAVRSFGKENWEEEPHGHHGDESLDTRWRHARART